MISFWLLMWLHTKAPLGGGESLRIMPDDPAGEDTGFIDLAGTDFPALSPQAFGGIGGNLFRQLVPLDQPPEFQECRLVGGSLVPCQPQPKKFPGGHAVRRQFAGGLVG